MIFEKTMQTVQSFDSIIKAANASFRETKKQILADYKEPMATNKIQEAKGILTEVKYRETQKAMAEVTADFAAVRRKVNEAVAASAPADFASTLAAIQAKGQGVTDYEANAYIEKYKGNYLAFSTILDVLHQVGKVGNVIAYKPDALDAQISEIEKMTMNWIHSHGGGNDYYSAILTSEQHSPIVKLGAEVQAFFDGYVLGDSKTAKFDDEEKLAAELNRLNHGNT